MEKIVESDRGISYNSPCISNDILYYCSSDTGDILRRVQNQTQAIGNTKGVPNSLCFDVRSGKLIICDFSHNALLSMNEHHEITEYVKSFENKLFKGPNTVVSSSNGTLFFTDSGPLGETTLSNPGGSVFSVVDEFVQPLAFQCLAHPSGIALSPNEDAIYVCETLQNRVLRFIQRPSGVYHYSVFHQFSGRLGPSAIAVDRNGFLYVSHFEFSELEKGEEPLSGLITVLTPKGKKHHEIKVAGSEITHLAFDPEKRFLFISEKSSKSIYRIQCAN